MATCIEEAVTASASLAPTPDDKNVNTVQKTKYKKKYKPTGTGSTKKKTAVQNESSFVIDAVQKLEELESPGVIEKIDASEWVFPIVVSYKSKGDVRLCVDLRIDYCGFGPFCSAPTKLLLTISPLKVLICLLY